MQILKDIKTGFFAFPRGLGWLLKRPKYLGLLMLPVFFAVGLWAYGLFWLDELDAWLMEAFYWDKPAAWYIRWLWWVGKALMITLIRVLSLLVCVILINILFVPVYEWVSCGVESSKTGKEVPDIGVWRSILLITEEIKKAAFMIALSLLSIFFLQALGFVVAAALVGWDLIDYPLARRGLSFRERLSFLWNNIGVAFGIGVWLMIPFAAVLFYPLAIAGGSLVAMERLEKAHVIR
jgi:uncharacterized protein involved in cysteine biosynthesis